MFGLSDEQIAQVKDESWGKVYEENGLTSMGTWGEDGLFYWTDKLVEDTTLRTALICQRLPSRACSSKQALVGTPEYIQAQSEWRIYENTAYGKVEWLANYLSSEDSRKYSIATANLQDYTTKNVYKFITGEKNLDSDWSNYVGMIDKYGAKDFETKFNELRKELLG